jgi:hypothetical protein
VIQLSASALQHGRLLVGQRCHHHALFVAQLGSATYGDLVIAPDNTMYMTISKKLIRIPNYTTITGTGLIPSVEVGNILPTGVGFNFTTQGSGTYGFSWDHTNNNIMVISSRTTDGSDGSYNVNPATGGLVGSFRVNCLATPTSTNFADLTSVISSIGVAKQSTAVQCGRHHCNTKNVSNEQYRN